MSEQCGYPCVACNQINAEPLIGDGTRCMRCWFKDNPEVKSVIFEGYKYTQTSDIIVCEPV